VLDGPARWKRAQLTVPWGAVRPAALHGETARSR
jgi:hypothetical protein